MTDIISAVIVVAFLAVVGYVNRERLGRVMDALPDVLLAKADAIRVRSVEAYEEAYIAGYEDARAQFLPHWQQAPAARQRGGNDGARAALQAAINQKGAADA